MVFEIRAPEAADEVTEITVLSWKKQEGDTVRAGEALCEVEYGKSVLEVEAQASGTLREIVVREKEMATCGAVLARLFA